MKHAMRFENLDQLRKWADAECRPDDPGLEAKVARLMKQALAENPHLEVEMIREHIDEAVQDVRKEDARFGRN